MSKERLKSPRARLFIALDLPDPVLSRIEAWERSALSDPALRVLPPANLHVTLAFLGYLPEREIERLERIVAGARRGAPEMALLDPVAVPSPRRPRLFALPMRSPEAEALQGELEEALVSERLYKPEKRAFWPHLTVARVRSEGRGSKRLREVEKPPGTLPRGLAEPFHAVRLTLYRSKLQPQGAEYIPLAQVELPHDGRQ